MNYQKTSKGHDIQGPQPKQDSTTEEYLRTMSEIEKEIADRLAAAGITPLIGGLVPEPATAELIGYAPSYLRRLAAEGLAPLPFVRRGNRRFYKIADIVSFATNTAA